MVTQKRFQILQTPTLAGSTTPASVGVSASREIIMKPIDVTIPHIQAQILASGTSLTPTNVSCYAKFRKQGVFQHGVDTPFLRNAALNVEATIVSGTPLTNSVQLLGSNNFWNAVGQVATAATSSATSIILGTGQGATFGSGTLPVPLTAYILSMRQSSRNDLYEVIGYEVVTITSVSTDTLTVVRSAFTQPLTPATVNPVRPAQLDPFELPSAALPVNTVIVATTQMSPIVDGNNLSPTRTTWGTSGALPGSINTYAVQMAGSGAALNQFNVVKAVCYGPNEASTSASFRLSLEETVVTGKQSAISS